MARLLRRCGARRVRDAPTSDVERALQCVGESDSKVRAYVHVFADRARAEAERRHREIARGPLHGLPFAAKEVFDVAGVETAGGCRAFAGRIPGRDATVIERLRTQGAVLIGTQVSHELTCGLDQPPTRNPWNLGCYPGGSSAGAGVSVAVGSAMFALGTDAAGSVRIPAAMTGVVGFKPTIGCVSKSGIMRQASAPSIDNVGIVARNAHLVAQVMAAIAGPDPGDVQTLFHPPPLPQESALKMALRGRRFATFGERTVAALDAIYAREPDVIAAFDRACRQFCDAGAEPVVIEVPGIGDAIQAIVTLFSTELAFAHRDHLQAKLGSYNPDVSAMLQAALATPAGPIADATAVRARLRKDVDAAISEAGADFLITPTTPRAAMALASFNPRTELATLIPYTCLFNLTGHPAASVPNGMTDGGLPIGLQIVGKHYRDHEVLEIAELFENLNAPTDFSKIPLSS